jgi:acyl-CoA thioester hydrolase
MRNRINTQLKYRDNYLTWTSASIRYCDLDPNGHVNNGAINSFFEDGRVQFRNDRMIILGDSVLRGFVIAKFSVEYLKTLYYPGFVDIGTVVQKIGSTSYVLGQGIFTSEDCIATAEVVTVCLNDLDQKPLIIKGKLRLILEKSLSSMAPK